MEKPWDGSESPPDDQPIAEWLAERSSALRALLIEAQATITELEAEVAAQTHAADVMEAEWKQAQATIGELEAEVATLRAEQASQSRHCPECVRLEAKVVGHREILMTQLSDERARYGAAQATIARVEGEREDARHEAETYRTAIHDRRQHPEVELEVFGNHRFPWERAALTPPEET